MVEHAISVAAKTFVLHGRDEFETGAGTRVLVGCYIDRDDVLSRLRVLHRPTRSGQVRTAIDTTRTKESS